MPVYMDTHDSTNLPDALRQKVASRVRSGEKDAFGVVDRGIVIDKVAGKMHCVLDAPNTEAIMKHHQSLDVPLVRETIHEADIILR